VSGHRSKGRLGKRLIDCFREDVTQQGNNMQMAVEKTKDQQQWRESIVRYLRLYDGQDSKARQGM